MKFVDIHTHILYGIDDGADSLETSLEMIDRAYRDGARAVFLTPHCHEGSLDFNKVNDALIALKPHIREKYKDLLVYGGCELLFGDITLTGLLSGKIPTLADSNYILIEFFPAVKAEEVMWALRTATSNGYFPIIAHAERYGRLKEKDIEEFVDAGAYIQLNAQSVCGKAGGAVKRFCHKLLRDGLVHFIASDCHNLSRRPPGLFECAELVAKKYGEDYAESIFCKNALRVVENEII